MHTGVCHRQQWTIRLRRLLLNWLNGAVDKLCFTNFGSVFIAFVFARPIFNYDCKRNLWFQFHLWRCTLMRFMNNLSTRTQHQQRLTKFRNGEKIVIFIASILESKKTSILAYSCALCLFLPFFRRFRFQWTNFLENKLSHRLLIDCKMIMRISYAIYGRKKTIVFFFFGFHSKRSLRSYIYRFTIIVKTKMTFKFNRISNEFTN